MFMKEVVDRLGFYVYRLIDPRNGETFYVGKGRGNRVFEHAKGARTDDDAEDMKLQRIREIVNRDGLEIQHVIHRHGMDEKTAIEVEAALIDAYPQATNLVNGHDSGDRGLMHAKQIIERYEAKEAVFQHKVVLISINRSADKRDLYEAVRCAWKLDPKKASQAQLVLAVVQGLIVGVFVADEWLPATSENFPGRGEVPDRWGFRGREAPIEIAHLYLRHRIPDSMRKPGAANPIRYVL
jgi:hypothetical protein